jgi:hypothetical protein
LAEQRYRKVLVSLTLLLSTAAKCNISGGGISGDTPVTIKVELKAGGSSRTKQIKIDWHGAVPTINQRVTWGWERTYYMRTGKVVDFTVTNKSGIGNVSCTINVEGKLERNDVATNEAKCHYET